VATRSSSRTEWSLFSFFFSSLVTLGKWEGRGLFLFFLSLRQKRRARSLLLPFPWQVFCCSRRRSIGFLVPPSRSDTFSSLSVLAFLFRSNRKSATTASPLFPLPPPLPVGRGARPFLKRRSIPPSLLFPLNSYVLSSREKRLFRGRRPSHWSIPLSLAREGILRSSLW